jgi:hypothetical protein
MPLGEHPLTVTSDSTVELVLELRKTLIADGLDAGLTTLAWWLEHRHGIRLPGHDLACVAPRAGVVDEAVAEAAPLVLHPLRR